MALLCWAVHLSATQQQVNLISTHFYRQHMGVVCLTYVAESIRSGLLKLSAVIADIKESAESDAMVIHSAVLGLKSPHFSYFSVLVGSVKKNSQLFLTKDYHRFSQVCFL